ncbi:MAG: nucleotidyl transferase AbiEii/AbiGii toxin family protein [bacterium]
MRIEKDYEELLELFNKHRVKYCIVGSYALAFHAKPRYTKDLDILIEPSGKNAARILQALNEFGFGSLDLEEKDFTEPGQIIQLGYEPVRIDLLTSIEGMEFSEIYKNRSTGQFGHQQVPFMSIDDLIASKKISNRGQDLADLETLREFKEKNN